MAADAVMNFCMGRMRAAWPRTFTDAFASLMVDRFGDLDDATWKNVATTVIEKLRKPPSFADLKDLFEHGDRASSYVRKKMEENDGAIYGQARDLAVEIEARFLPHVSVYAIEKLIEDMLDVGLSYTSAWNWARKAKSLDAPSGDENLETLRSALIGMQETARPTPEKVNRFMKIAEERGFPGLIAGIAESKTLRDPEKGREEDDA